MIALGVQTQKLLDKTKYIISYRKVGLRLEEYFNNVPLLCALESQFSFKKETLQLFWLPIRCGPSTPDAEGCLSAF